MVGHTGEKNRERFVVMNLISQNVKRLNSVVEKYFFFVLIYLMNVSFNPEETKFGILCFDLANFVCLTSMNFG